MSDQVRFLLGILAFALIVPSAAMSQSFSERRAPGGVVKLVLLDPGHGGVDLGARSPKSYLEKTVALKLAQAIVAQSKKYPTVAVALTREGDLERTNIKRLELANLKRADLYISIHTGGGFSPQARPMEIFIAENKKGEAVPGGWSLQNLPYDAANIRLAKKISTELTRVRPEREIRVVKSGRLALEGLAAPAMIIEPLDLSNPQDEIMLEDSEFIDKIASAITKGMMDFLGVKEQEGHS
jgi:N-acetylmuramoyl-L-alanine amidase